MKTSARFLAMLVAVLMIASAAITVSAFSDVEDGYEHATAIATLNQLGVIGGYEDGTFKPNDPVQRDEMAKLVYVLYTTFADAGSNATGFKDVPASHWATGYVAWCSAMNIVGGFGDGTFKPDDNITYDQALKMVCATLGYTDFDSKLWPTDVRQKAITDLKLNAGLEKVNGSDKLTRGQVAQLLYNALDKDMNETKIEYVYDTSYEDADGNEVKVKVPVEVAKTLAEDVWGFEEIVIRVLGTENLVYNAAASKTNDGETIKAATYTVAQNGTVAYGTVETYELADLGLEAYKDNTDALIGLDIMTIEKGEELLAKATVLGTVKIANVTIGGRDSDGVPAVDEVTIDGVLYDDAKKSETLFANLKTLTYTSSAVNTTLAFPELTLVDADTAVLEYPHTALVMDNEGDGVVDAIAIGYYEPYVVTNVKAVKATSTVAAHTLYTVNADLTATTGGTAVKSLDIADGKTLAKGDIFVAANIAGTWYVDAVVEATKDAVVTKLTSDTATLKDIGDVKLGKVFNTAAAETVSDNMLNYVDGKAQTADYYLYNNTVIFTTASEEAAESYDLAILLYVDKAGEGVIVNNKLQTAYTAVLLIDGKQTTVNLDAASAIIKADGSVVSAFNASADGSDYRTGLENDGETVKYLYDLVTYTVDNDGEYTLSYNNPNLGKTVVVATGAALTVNANTGLIYVGGNKVVLDDASVIYYTYGKDAADDNFTYLGTYTSANILPKFVADTTTDATFLLDNEDGTYTLIASMIDDELEAPDAEVKATYKNDARLIKYATTTSAAESVEGVAYYSYAFLDFATMKNGSLVLDTTKSVADGAVKAVAGKFYGWDNANEVYVEVNDAVLTDDQATDIDESKTIQIGTVANVNTTLGIVDLAGTDWADGIKLGADVKIFGAANKTYSNQYKTFDLAALAELLAYVEEYNLEEGYIDENGNDITDETADPVVINCAVGTYVDEEGDRQIAWIIVDNYYDVEETDGTVTFTKASNIVGAID